MDPEVSDQGLERETKGSQGREGRHFVAHTLGPDHHPGTLTSPFVWSKSVLFSVCKISSPLSKWKWSHSSCVQLCDPMDCSLWDSSIHGIFQARVLEWVAISFSRGIFLTQGSNPGLPHCRQTYLSHRGSSSFKPHPRYYQLIITLSGLPLLPRQFQALPQGFKGTWKEPLWSCYLIVITCFCVCLFC